VALSFQKSPFTQFELMWSRSDSTVAGTVIIQPLLTEDLCRVHMDQSRTNFLALLPRSNTRLVPYLLVGLGLTYANPYGETKGITRFSRNLGGGVKAMIGDRIGLNACRRDTGRSLGIL